MNATLLHSPAAAIAPCRAARALRRLRRSLLAVALAACSAGGGPRRHCQPADRAPPRPSAYTGPAPANADVLAFQINLWQNIIRSGSLRRLPPRRRPVAAVRALGRREPRLPGGAAAGEPHQPGQSTLVLKVGSGHNCWVADPSACAATMLCGSRTGSAAAPPPPPASSWSPRRCRRRAAASSSRPTPTELPDARSTRC